MRFLLLLPFRCILWLVRQLVGEVTGLVLFLLHASFRLFMIWLSAISGFGGFWVTFCLCENYAGRPDGLMLIPAALIGYYCHASILALWSKIEFWLSGPSRPTAQRDRFRVIQED